MTDLTLIPPLARAQLATQIVAVRSYAVEAELRGDRDLADGLAAVADQLRDCLDAWEREDDV